MRETIQQIVDGVVDGSMSDAEVIDWLQDVFDNGMNRGEIAELTEAMTYSGTVLSWPEEYAHLVVDKHSTGGVGDKVSLPLAAAVAACGAKVPMVSGRGLGHTGGTLDKLEAMPGYTVSLSIERFQTQVAEIGCAIVGQTADMAPADKRMYALRDVSGFIASTPLVTGSIISKKAAAGLSALVMDVKVGRAAFMKTVEEAQELAKCLASSGRDLGIDTSVLLTEMDNPIGYAIGNALEVIESVETLLGNGPRDLEELVCVQGGIMLAAAGLTDDEDEGARMIFNSLHDGSALAKFIAMSTNQGASPSLFGSEHSLMVGLGLLDDTLKTTEIKAADSGWVQSIDALALAEVCRDLGAGRKRVDENIDMQVGMLLEVGVSSQVERGEVWVTIYHRGQLDGGLLRKVEEALTISDCRVEDGSRILAKL